MLTYGRSGQISITALIFFFYIACIIFFLFFKIQINLLFLSILASSVFIISFFNPNLALIILIFSIFFSPEMRFGDIPGRAIVFRVEDLFLLLIFFGWVAKIAINKELGLLKSTPLNGPIFAYIAVCLVSTGWGILHGYSDPLQSVFYLLKYFEYFMIYFMVVNTVKTMKQVNIFMACFMLTCVMVCTYALIFTAKTGFRASAPFEGEGGESNTLAGYLLLMLSVTLGLLLHSEKTIHRVTLLSVLIVIFITFIYTLSRGAWIGFPAMYLILLVFIKRRKIFLLLFLMVFVFITAYFFKDIVSRRVTATFEQGKDFNLFGKRFNLDGSAMIRINNMKWWAERVLKKSPFLGFGIPGGGVVGDIQYARIFREVGIIGFLIFIWLNIIILKTAWISYITCHNNIGRGLSIGLLAGIAGLLVQGIAAEVYIIIRIMEPFWFLAAIVIVMPEISASSDSK